MHSSLHKLLFEFEWSDVAIKYTIAAFILAWTLGYAVHVWQETKAAKSHAK